MNPAAIESARQAFAATTAAKQGAQAERDKLAALKLRREQAQDERERLRAAKDEDAARVLLSGAEALLSDDSKPHGNSTAARKAKARDDRLATLDDEIPALEVAIRLQQQRIADADSAVAAPQLAFTAPVLDLVCEAQGAAVAEIRAGMAALAPALARLIAADQIRTATIGERFPLPDGKAPPIGGLPLFRAFAKALPERFKPAELAETLLFQAAHAISSETIASIKGEA